LALDILNFVRIAAALAVQTDASAALAVASALGAGRLLAIGLATGEPGGAVDLHPAFALLRNVLAGQVARLVGGVVLENRAMRSAARAVGGDDFAARSEGLDVVAHLAGGRADVRARDLDAVAAAVLLHLEALPIRRAERLVADLHLGR